MHYYPFQDNHPNQYQNYFAARATEPVKKRQRGDDEIPDSQTVKQVHLVSTIEKFNVIPPGKRLKQSEFEGHLVEMLVEDMQPLATVERQGFRKFCGLVMPQYSLPSRRQAGRILNDMYEREKKLMELLIDVRWISATADLWGAHKRAYMGVTIHFINPETLKMVSSALACRRFHGAHTAVAIGTM